MIISSFGMFLCSLLQYNENNNKIQSVVDIADDLFFGQFRKEIVLNEYDGYDLAKEKERVDKARTERAKKLLSAVKMFVSKSKSDFSKTDMDGKVHYYLFYRV